MTHARTLAALAIASPAMGVFHLMVFTLSGLSMTMGLPGTGTADPVTAVASALIPVALFPAWRTQLTTTGERLPLPVSPLRQSIVEALWYTLGTATFAVLFKLSLIVLGGPFEPVAVAKGLLLVATPLPLVATLLAIKPVRGGLAWAVAAPVVGLVLAAISLFFDPPDWIPGLLLAGGFAISLRTVWPHLRGGSRAPESMARTPGEATATLRKDTLSGIARASLQATLLVPLSWILAAQITALTADAPDAVTVLAILLPVGAILAPTLRPLNRSLDTWMPQGTAAPFELLPLPTGALRRAISAHILTLTVVTIGLTLASVQLLTALNMHSSTAHPFQAMLPQEKRR